MNKTWQVKYLNKIVHGDCIELLKDIPPGTIDLIIADPPYFKVIGQKWDYVWRTLDDYLDWSLEWIKESSRVLRLG